MTDIANRRDPSNTGEIIMTYHFDAEHMGPLHGNGPEHAPYAIVLCGDSPRLPIYRKDYYDGLRRTHFQHEEAQRLARSGAHWGGSEVAPLSAAEYVLFTMGGAIPERWGAGARINSASGVIEVIPAIPLEAEPEVSFPPETGPDGKIVIGARVSWRPCSNAEWRWGVVVGVRDFVSRFVTEWVIKDREGQVFEIREYQIRYVLHRGMDITDAEKWIDAYGRLGNVAGVPCAPFTRIRNA